MDKVSQLYFNSCTTLGLNPIEIQYINGFRVDLGKNTYYFRSGCAPFNDSASVGISNNKYSSNKTLYFAGLPVPQAVGITHKEYKKCKLENILKLHFPLVIKPTWDTSCGHGVICNIKNMSTLISLLEYSFKKYKCMSIEECKTGLRSYRVLVFYNQVIGVVERIPAHVVGDGTHSISELIDIENARRKNLIKQLPLGKIKITKETELIFNELNISAGYIPKLDEKIPLRYICNSTFGGSIIGLDVKTICKQNADLACKAAKALNLHLVGLDILCKDIGIPIEQSSGFFIEANANPDITIHENVVNGVATPVSKIIIKHLIYKHSTSYILQKANLQDNIVVIVHVFLFVFLIIWGVKEYVF